MVTDGIGICEDVLDMSGMEKRRCLRILWSAPIFYPHTGFIHDVDIEEVTPPTVSDSEIAREMP